MALLSPTFFDTSVLLSGIIELAPGGSPAQRLLAAIADRRLKEPHTAWHCCLEFFAVATRLPEEFRLDPMDAARLVEEEILGRFRVDDFPKGSRKDFWSLAARGRIAGGRIYDAHIAETAASAGARTVVTDNLRHFDHLAQRGIRVLSSADAAAAL